MSGTFVIVGVADADVPQGILPLPGSVTAPCVGCDRPTWLSPSSQQVQAHAMVLCRVCYDLVADVGPKVRILLPTAVEELAALRRQVVEELAALNRPHGARDP